MRKICFLSGYFNRFDLNAKSQGGAEYQNYLLKSELEKKNYQVYFISLGDRNEIYRDGNTIIIYIRKKKLTRKLGDNFCLYLPHVYNIINRIRPSIIYQRMSHSWTYAASLYAHKNKIKFIWAAAGEEDVKPFKKDRLHNLLFNFLDHLLARYGQKRADTIIVQAEYQRDLLLKNYNLVADAVIKNYHPLPCEKIERKGQFQIIWVANFSRNKQPHIFVELAKYFEEKKYPITFLMIGRPYNEYKQKMIETDISALNNIQYLGPKDQEFVNRSIAESYLVVNTSILEGFSNVYIQAWLRGTVVYSLNSDPDKLLSEKGLGFCAYGNFQALVAAIENLFTDKEKWFLFSQKCRQYSTENHSIENQISKLLPFFK